ncbi:hypothetical protein LXL04_006824 [Taraxacum kok-saghyz]
MNSPTFVLTLSKLIQSQVISSEEAAAEDLGDVCFLPKDLLDYLCLRRADHAQTFCLADFFGISRDLPQPSSMPSSERPAAPTPPISAEASSSSICGLQTDLPWLFIPATKVLFVDLWPTNLDVKKQTVFFLQTADVWSTSSAAESCRCGPQTADVLVSKKQTPP